MMVLEESKSWAEADGDTAEAIDFCEFYAREMERLAQPQPLTPYPGEKNELEFIPLGVVRRHPAVELPARDPDRHDDGRARHRQHGRAEALLRRRRRSRRCSSKPRGGRASPTAS